jgi:hypothetical protein
LPPRRFISSPLASYSPHPETKASTVVPVIELTTEVLAPIERMFDLSRSVELRMASTAHTGERAVAGVTSGLMTLGQEITWRARHFGIWQHLTSRITAFERPFHFRDSLVRGVFQRFDPIISSSSEVRSRLCAMCSIFSRRLVFSVTSQTDFSSSST